MARLRANDEEPRRQRYQCTGDRQYTRGQQTETEDAVDRSQRQRVQRHDPVGVPIHSFEPCAGSVEEGGAEESLVGEMPRGIRKPSLVWRDQTSSHGSAREHEEQDQQAEKRKKSLGAETSRNTPLFADSGRLNVCDCGAKRHNRHRRDLSRA